MPNLRSRDQGDSPSESAYLPNPPGVNSRWDNLIGGWPMNEFSDGSVPVTRVDALGIHNLTDTNTVPSGAGRIWNGASFTDADNDYLINEPTSAFAFLSGASMRTVALWAYLTDDAGSPLGIFSTGDVVLTREGSCQVFLSAGDLLVEIVDSTNTARQLNVGTPTLNAWHSIVIWHDGSPGVHHVAVDDGTPVDFVGNYTLAAAAGSNADFVGFGVSQFSRGTMNGVVDNAYCFSDVKDAAWRTGFDNGGVGVEYPY